MAVDLLAFLDMARDRVGQAVEAPQLRARPTPDAVRPPYVLLLMAPPDRASERFAGVSSLRDGLLATEVGATSAEQAMWLHNQLDGALLDWRPEIEGAWYAPLTYYARPRLIEPATHNLPGVPLWTVSTLWDFRAEPDETQEWA